MKKILLTGGSGFAGRNLLEYISKYTFKTDEYVIDAPSSKELNMLDEASVSDWLTGKAAGSSLNNGESYDTVLHFAVYTDAADKTRDASKMLEYNLLSFMIFYKYRKLYGRMFYTGSGAEFDKRADICSAKEDSLEAGEHAVPTDQYGLMKYTIGRLIDESDNIYNLRIFGLFGKYEYSFRFITQMCQDSIAGRQLKVNQNVYFDYLYIDDFCQMVCLLLEKYDLKYHSYNIVSGQRHSLLEICDMVNAAAQTHGKEVKPVIVVNEGLNKEYTASGSRLHEELNGYSPLPLSIAVKKLYAHYLTQIMD